MIVLALFRRAPAGRGCLNAFPGRPPHRTVLSRRAFSSHAQQDSPLLKNTRNIGIIAHVDAVGDSGTSTSVAF